MAELKAGPYTVNIHVKEILGDISDRSLAGIRYLVKLGFRDAADLCYCGFADCDPSQIRTDGTCVVDDAPDKFYGVCHYALHDGEEGSHWTCDEQLSIGISAGTGNCFSILGICEPLNFEGDPDNVFRVVAVVNPWMTDKARPPGGGVAIVLPMYRSDLEAFISTWLAEVRNAPRTKQFQKQDHDGHLLRWMPPKR